MSESEAPEYNHLQLSSVDQVLWITIDNPPINLITKSLLVDLIRLSHWLENDSEHIVVVFQSANPNFFLAHFDVTALLDSPNTQQSSSDHELNIFYALCERLRVLPKVTICKISGRIGGGGSEIAMACDMRFADLEKTKMNQMEVPIGIIPGGGGTQRLPSLVGYSRAAELILGGIDLDARTGEEWGYFTRSLPSEELDEYVNWLANRIAAFDPAAVIGAKASLQNSLPSLTDGLINETTIFNNLCYSQEGQRSLRKFLELGGQTIEGELRISDLSAEVTGNQK
ncbi:MAG: enoyl-CoA hydratase/isomerase family protein [Actinomycetota bacterium]|nr:enoyl-CoA hydratase/isomerase family protein [Actinomycetota bacterium]